MSESTYDRVYNQGWDAQERGGLIIDCPYTGAFSEAWEEGFLDSYIA